MSRSASSPYHGVTQFIVDPPYIKKAKIEDRYVGPRSPRGSASGASSLLLDKGQREDWFSSDLIVWLAVIAAVASTFLVIVELRSDHPWWTSGSSATVPSPLAT